MNQQEKFLSFAQIVKDRRTSKIYDGKEVLMEDLNALIEMARYAPNHRLNEPWRFRILQQASIKKLIDHTRQQLSETEILPLEKPIGVLLQAGALIYVTSVVDQQKLVDEENFAAVSAAVQNILLGATAKGILSFWSSNKIMLLPTTRQFLKIPDHERFVGGIILGFGKPSEFKERPLPLDEVCLWI